MIQPVWRGANPNNFSRSRGGFAPEAVVVHVIADKLDNSISGTDAWFNNPEAKASAHYAVRADGFIHQYVRDEHRAFHAGKVVRPTWTGIRGAPEYRPDPNYYTIGIEHEGNAESIWPEPMMQASAELIASICKRWDIPADRDHIVMHRELRANKACPGKCDIDRLVAMVQAQLTEAPAT